MACSLRSHNSLNTLMAKHGTLLKLGRLCCRESYRKVNEGTRDPEVQKNDSGGAPRTQTRIKNELSYHLPTVSLPPKLADSVKEVLKRECTIRVF